MSREIVNQDGLLREIVSQEANSREIVNLHVWKLEKKHENSLRILEFNKRDGYYEKLCSSQLREDLIKVYIMDESE